MTTTAVDISDGGCGGGKLRLEIYIIELGEAGHSGNAEAVELEEAILAELTSAAVDQVSACKSDGGKENGIKSVYMRESREAWW